MRFCALPIITALALAIAGDRAAHAQSWNLYDGGGSVTVGFVNTISGDDTQPTVQLGFDNSGTFGAFTMDTGSVGILASSQYFQPTPGSKRLGEGSQYYSSDHRTEYGVWWEATQQIYSNGVMVAEAKVPVLQVTHEKHCDANGNNCQWNYSPDVHMMGIGFAREGAVGQTDPHRHSPEYNAFLNLTAVAITPGGPTVALPDDWHNGYVVSADQVQLGLTQGNTANAGFIKLTPNPTYYTPTNKEWSLVPASITADSQPPLSGTVLMDTGLAPGILTPTGAVHHHTCGDNECADHGTHLAISLPTGDLQIFSYEFEMGVADPMRPHEVHLPGGTGAFFNTGFRVFNGINLIFDADNGFTGYQLAASGAGSPTVNMWMALGGPFTIPHAFTSDLPLVLFAPSTLRPEGLADFREIIAGSQSLTIDGPGWVTFSAVNIYTGPTTIAHGRLSVDGSIVSDVEVQSGGVLGGVGEVADVTVLAGGMYAPGNSIGTQRVSGNLVFQPGSTFEVEVNASGASDVAVVSGAIEINGGALQVELEPGSYGPVNTYRIIENDGSFMIGGAFDAIVNPYVFFLASVEYNVGPDDDVDLTLVRSTDYSAVARTHNELAVANSLEMLPYAHPLVQAIQLQTLEGALQAFNALSGEAYATTASVIADQTRYVRQALNGRLMQAGQGGGTAVALAGAAAPSEVAERPVGMMALGAGGEGWAGVRNTTLPSLVFWSKAYGAWGDFEDNGNAASASRTLGGVLTGADTALNGNWRFGLATGYSQSSISVRERNSSAGVDTVHLAAYAGGPVGTAVLRSGAAWGWNSIDSSRAVVFPGFVEQEAASYGGDSAQAFGELALPTPFYRAVAEPFAGLAYVHVGMDGFAESGPLAGLVGNATSDDVGYSTLGLRLASVLPFAGADVTTRASAAWQHAFGDVDSRQAVTFAAGGAPFVVGGVPIARDSALVEAGLDVELGPSALLELSYFGQLAADAQDNAVEGRFNWAF